MASSVILPSHAFHGWRNLSYAENINTCVSIGAYAFAQVNMGAYLLGQVEFAFADFATPLALMCARYAAIAVLVAAVFHYVRRIIEALGKRN